MGKEKFYAVKVGKQTGIFKTWEECKQSINGYPGAIHKSFNNKKDAELFLNDNSEIFANKENIDLNEQIKQEINNGITVIFVDGSYENYIKKYSYGSYIVFKEKSEIKEYEFSESFNNEKYLEFRNVSGEIFGIIKSLEWCLQNNKKNVKFYYDYIGIEKWFNNEWKANTEISIFYKNFLNENKNKFDSIQFQKVEAHSGIEYNEKVDKLAKKALLN